MAQIHQPICRGRSSRRFIRHVQNLCNAFGNNSHRNRRANAVCVCVDAKRAFLTHLFHFVSTTLKSKLLDEVLCQVLNYERNQFSHLISIANCLQPGQLVNQLAFIGDVRTRFIVVDHVSNMSTLITFDIITWARWRWRSNWSNWRIFGFTSKWHCAVYIWFPLFRNVYATHMCYTWCASQNEPNGNGANTIKTEKRWNEKHSARNVSKKSTHKIITEKWLLRLYYNAFIHFFHSALQKHFELMYAFAHKREFFVIRTHISQSLKISTIVFPFCSFFILFAQVRSIFSHFRPQWTCMGEMLCVCKCIVIRT